MFYLNRSRLNEALREAGYDIDGERYPEGYQEAPLAYDAVWAVALGTYSCFLCTNKLREKLWLSFVALFCLWLIKIVFLFLSISFFLNLYDTQLGSTKYAEIITDE